jgi:hypothetical protein
MKTKPTMHVNLHCEEGRGMFQLDLSSFLGQEREFMLKVFDEAEKGAELTVLPTEDGRFAMIFTVGKPIQMAETAEMVQ